MLKRYAEPLAKIEQRFPASRTGAEVAIWGLETRILAPTGGAFPTFTALATLAYDCRRATYRAELIDALMLVQRGVVRPNQLRGAWAGELGRPQFMPWGYLQCLRPLPMAAVVRISFTIPRTSSLRPPISCKAWLAARRGLGRRRTELRGHPAMEPRADLRQDRGVVCRQACRAIGGQATPRWDALGASSAVATARPTAHNAELGEPPRRSAGQNPRGSDPKGTLAQVRVDF